MKDNPANGTSPTSIRKKRCQPPNPGKLIAHAMLAGFLFAGGPLLGVLVISEPALSIAGGIVLFLISVRMVFPEVHGPLAETYVAGPSTLATVLLLTSREPSRRVDW